jgi:hypothetical protein
MCATVAAVSQNYRYHHPASSYAHGYLMEDTEMFTEGTWLYMVRVMDNIHILHTYIAYALFDSFK